MFNFILTIIGFLIGLWSFYLGVFSIIRSDPSLKEAIERSESLCFSRNARHSLRYNIQNRFLHAERAIFGNTILSKKALLRSIAISVALTGFSFFILGISFPHDIIPSPVTTPITFLSTISLQYYILFFLTIVCNFLIDFASLTKSRFLLRLTVSRRLALLRRPQSSSIQTTTDLESDRAARPSTAIIVMIGDSLLSLVIFYIGFSTSNAFIYLVKKIWIRDDVVPFDIADRYSLASYFGPVRRLFGEHGGTSFGWDFASVSVVMPDGKSVWMLDLITEMILMEMWPLFFLGTFGLLVVSAVFLASIALTEMAAFSASLVGIFVKRRLHRPGLLLRDCAILTALTLVSALFFGPGLQ